MRILFAFLILLLFSAAVAQQLTEETPPAPVTTVNTPLQIDMRSYQIAFPGFTVDQLEFTYSDPLPTGSSIVEDATQQFLVTYTPALNFIGIGTFEVKICAPTTPPSCFDSKINPRSNETAPRPFPVEVVAATNQPPTFTGRTLNVTLGNTLTTALNAQDPENAPITYTLLTSSPLPATQATVQLTGNILEIVAAGAAVQAGNDVITVQASDGVNTVDATFTVSVQAAGGGDNGGGNNGGGDNGGGDNGGGDNGGGDNGTGGNIGDNQPPRFINNTPAAVISRTLSVIAGQSASDSLGIVNWDDNGTITRQQEPSQGSFTVSRSQSNTLQVTYTANANASGSDSFSIVLGDDDGGLTINYSVSITNDNGGGNGNDGGNGDNNLPPVASSSQQSISLNTLAFAQGNLLTLFGISDPDGDPLSITLQSAPTLGSLTLNDPALGDFRYTSGNQAGNETLTFAISDGRGGQISVQLLVTVNAVNTPPAPPSVDNTLVNITAVLGRLYQNNAFAQAGADSSTLVVSVVRFPNLGALSLNIQSGDYSYQPDNQSGVDSFILRFTAADGAFVDVTFAVDLQVNVPPTVAQGRLSITVEIDTVYSGNIIDQVSPADANGDPLLLSASQPPALGKLTVDPGTGEYFYDAPGSVGDDLFVLRFADPSGASVDVPVEVSIVLPPRTGGGGSLAFWQVLALLALFGLRRRRLM